MENTEEWLDIKENDNYEVSNLGQVRNKKTNKILKPSNCGGYLSVGLSKNGKKTTYRVHRLVSNAFINNEESKPQVNHLDKDKTNNDVNNLEWVTAKENIQHACNNGIRCGEKNGRSKLTTEQVIEIRDKYKFREYTQLQLGKEYNVRENHISRIIKKSVWKHI